MCARVRLVFLGNRLESRCRPDVPRHGQRRVGVTKAEGERLTCRDVVKSECESQVPGKKQTSERTISTHPCTRSLVLGEIFNADIQIKNRRVTVVGT